MESCECFNLAYLWNLAESPEQKDGLLGHLLRAQCAAVSEFFFEKLRSNDSVQWARDHLPPDVKTTEFLTEGKWQFGSKEFRECARVCVCVCVCLFLPVLSRFARFKRALTLTAGFTLTVGVTVTFCDWNLIQTESIDLRTNRKSIVCVLSPDPKTTTVLN